MKDNFVERMESHPKYRQLVHTRTRYGWVLTIIMMVVYYGYIGVIAFDKSLFAKPLGEGVMTVGIPVGLGVIIFTVVITGLYVRRANSEFDALNREILKEMDK